MEKIVEGIAAYASPANVRESEDSMFDRAPGRNIHAYAHAVIPYSAIQGETFQPMVVVNTIRIHLDVESLIKQARNEDEQLAIIAAINRFYLATLLGAADRRHIC